MGTWALWGGEGQRGLYVEVTGQLSASNSWVLDPHQVIRTSSRYRSLDFLLFHG